MNFIVVALALFVLRPLRVRQLALGIEPRWRLTTKDTEKVRLPRL